MLPKERKNKILKLLDENINISLNKMSDILNVSKSTLYKDFDELEKERFITKRYGNIELRKNTDMEHSYYRRLKKNFKRKRSIAKEAVNQIKDGETIFIDDSSTCFYLCDEFKKNIFNNITIITNSLFIPLELLVYENYKIISIGGLLDRETGSFSNDWLDTILKNIRGDKFFFSSLGISSKFGINDAYNPAHILVKEYFLENSDEAICLVDSTKFNVRGADNWVGFDRLRTIITDENLDVEILKKLQEKRVKVFLAKIR